MLKYFKLLPLLGVIIFLCTCNQPKTAQIPISSFFKTPGKSAFKISPDGKYISYLKLFNEKKNLFIRSLADGKERMATSFADYSVRGDYFWTYNNEIVFFQDDIALDELKMFALDIASLDVRNNSFSAKSIRISLIGRNKLEPDIVTIRMNKRDPANFDIYKLNIKTGQLNMYLVNPGNFTQWYPDADGNHTPGQSFRRG